MSNNKIEAHKITKPIQLLAAWLVGLAIVNVTFLTAASQITQPFWVPGLLSIASVANVPIFVVSIFLLQTKFRPEMQEDSYYSDYLNSKNSSITFAEAPKPTESIQNKIEDLSNKISELAEMKPDNLNEKVRELISSERIAELSERHHGSRTLSELYARPDFWNALVDDWGDEQIFQSDVESLVADELIILEQNNFKAAELTALGVNVAEYCEKHKRLFSQVKADFFYGSGKSNKKKQADA